MTILAIAGAEDQTLTEVSTVGSVAISSGQARTGGYSFRMPQQGVEKQNGVILVCDGKSELFFQGACWIVQSPNYADITLIEWRNGSTVLGAISVNNGAGGLKVWLGPKTTQIGTIGVGLNINSAFNLFEVHIKIDDSDGEIQIRLNGITQFSYSGDTKPGSDTTINNVVYYHSRTSYVGSYYTYWDDLIINDSLGSFFNSWPNGAKIWKVAVPTADGNYTQWSASSGSDYECIDEVPPSMTDFLESTTQGQKESFVFGDADASIKGIAAIVVRFWAQGGDTIKRLCRYSAADYLGDEITLTGAFNKVDDIMYEKPGGGAWTPAVFNDCEFGMEKQ